MADEFQYDVFLSHSSKDKAVVRPLAERLHAKAEVRRKREEMELQPSALILQPLPCAFGSDWAQLACPPKPAGRRRKAGTFRFRDPLNSAFAKRLRTHRQERRFGSALQPSAFILQPLANGSLAQFLYINWLEFPRSRELSMYAQRQPAAWKYRDRPFTRRFKFYEILETIRRERAL
jgi:hypothetical protein